MTYVGYKMFERIPPGQGVLGKPSVSNLQVVRSGYLRKQRVGGFNGLCVLARSSVVAAKVGSSVASEARLRLQILAHTVGGVANEHAEALVCLLSKIVSKSWDWYLRA